MSIFLGKGQSEDEGGWKEWRNRGTQSEGQRDDTTVVGIHNLAASEHRLGVLSRGKSDRGRKSSLEGLGSGYKSCVITLSTSSGSTTLASDATADVDRFNLSS